MRAFSVFLMKYIHSQIKYYHSLATSSDDPYQLIKAAIIRKQVAELTTHLDHVLSRAVSNEYLIDVSHKVIIYLIAESYDALKNISDITSSSSDCSQSVIRYRNNQQKLSEFITFCSMKIPGWRNVSLSTTSPKNQYLQNRQQLLALRNDPNQVKDHAQRQFTVREMTPSETSFYYQFDARRFIQMVNKFTKKYPESRLADSADIGFDLEESDHSNFNISHILKFGLFTITYTGLNLVSETIKSYFNTNHNGYQL